MNPGEQITERWRNSKILLLGGSAGAFKNILAILKALQPGLNKTVIIILHRKKNFVSDMVPLFRSICPLPVKEISDKLKISRGIVFLAPSNYHVLIEKKGCFGLDVSDAVWFSKPSIDVTFESAADTFGGNCTAVLLSGANVDGAAGLLKLKTAGSLTIVQNPTDAEMPEMPAAALALDAADHVLTADEIIKLLAE